MKKIRLNENDIEHLVKKIIKESEQINVDDAYKELFDVWGEDFIYEEIEDISIDNEWDLDVDTSEIADMLLDVLISNYGDEEEIANEKFRIQYDYTQEQLNSVREPLREKFEDFIIREWNRGMWQY